MEFFTFLLAFVATLGASTRGSYIILKLVYFKLSPVKGSDQKSPSKQTKSEKFRMPPAPRSLSKTELVLVNDPASKSELATISDQ